MALAINPDVMRWAVGRSGHTEEQVCRKFRRYPQWLDGTRTPTLKQLMDFTSMVHIDLCDVYADSIPDYGFQIADFRTPGGKGIADPSPELYDTIHHVQYRQGWMGEHFASEGREPVSFVGSWCGMPLTPNNARLLATGLHSFLGLDERWAFALKTVHDAVRTLRDVIESRGISVSINGVVGENSHRKLDVAEFRGFVLSDGMAPVIFINGRDAKGAQLFTMIHELAHLAYAQSGVVDPASSDSDDLGSGVELERFCDRAAAEFLVGIRVLTWEWSDSEDADAGLYDKISRISRRHKVTFMVVARQALDAGLVTRDEFVALCVRHREVMAGSAGSEKRMTGGGNAYCSKRYRLGTVFSEAVWSAYNEGAISLGDAYDLTGLTSKTFDGYYKRMFQCASNSSLTRTFGYLVLMSYTR